MTTVYVDYGSQTTVLSTEANSLANGSSAVSTSEVDNSTNRYCAGELDVEIAGASAGTGYVSVYLIEGGATGDLATYANLANARLIGKVQMNGTTAAQKTLKFDGVSKFWKALLYNGSGVALAASGNTIKFTGVRYTDT